MGFTVASTTVGGGPGASAAVDHDRHVLGRKAWATSSASVKRSGTVRHGPCSRHSRRRARPSGMPTTTAQAPLGGAVVEGWPPTSRVARPRVGPDPGRPARGRNTSTARASSAPAASASRRSTPRSACARPRSVRPRSAARRDRPPARPGAPRRRGPGPHGQAVAADAGHGRRWRRRPAPPPRRRDPRPTNGGSGLVKSGSRATSISLLCATEPCHQRTGATGQVRLDPHLVVPQLPRRVPCRAGLCGRQLDDHGSGPAEPRRACSSTASTSAKPGSRRRSTGPATSACRGSACTSGSNPAHSSPPRRAGSTPPGRRGRATPSGRGSSQLPSTSSTCGRRRRSGAAQSPPG